jgi:hypothetical protein
MPMIGGNQLTTKSLIVLPIVLIALSFLSLSSTYNAMMSALIFGSAILLIVQKDKTVKVVGYITLVLCIMGFLGSYVIKPSQLLQSPTIPPTFEPTLISSEIQTSDLQATSMPPRTTTYDRIRKSFERFNFVFITQGTSDGNTEYYSENLQIQNPTRLTLIFNGEEFISGEIKTDHSKPSFDLGIYFALFVESLFPDRADSVKWLSETFSSSFAAIKNGQTSFEKSAIFGDYEFIFKTSSPIFTLNITKK